MTALSEEFEKVAKLVRKEYGPSAVTTGDKVPDVERVPTGFARLDKILRGGWPKGRIIEVWGPQSAGKTMLLMRTVAVLQAANPKARIVYFDLENTFDKAWASKFGVNLQRLFVVKAVPAERAGDLLLRVIRDKWDMAIVDSVVEMIPEKVLGKDTGQQTYAPVATVLSALLPKVVVLQSNSPTIVILVNQVRDNIGFFLGKGTKSPGGNALYHLDSLKLRVQRKEPITGALLTPALEKRLTEYGVAKILPKKDYGYVMAIKVVKSKVSKEKEFCLLPVLFDIGIVEEAIQGATTSGKPASGAAAGATGQGGASKSDAVRDGAGVKR